MSDECYLASILFRIKVHAFVLMPNHFHLLVTTPEQDLGKVMNTFMSDVTRTINRLSGRSGRIFGGPYHWSLIHSSLYYAHALKYVYRNPIKAKIVNKVEEYPWSTLYGVLGKSHCPIPIWFPRSGLGISFVPDEMNSLLEWLNRPFLSETELLIQKGLKKKYFGLLKNRNVRKEEKILKNQNL